MRLWFTEPHILKGHSNMRSLIRQHEAKIILLTLLAWCVYQLWYSSPLPYFFGIFIHNENQARVIHLCFGLFITYLTTRNHSIQAKNQQQQPARWLIAISAVISCFYLFAFNESLAYRPGAPILIDTVIAIIGIVCLLEAARRALGPALTLIASLFLVYSFLGPVMPDLIAHKGVSLEKAVSHYWLTSEGVFGVALGVSTSVVFLYVLFGALLEASGAGKFFIQLAYACLGHLRGGPAKAAVVSSAMTGLISGSSISNVVTTGTFTIPLMRKMGLSAEKSGAIEVASSTNGQLMPPVMGAAAFLIIEYAGVSYIDLIKHAILPALLSYVSLIYIVHLEAIKLEEKVDKSSFSWLSLFKLIKAIALCILFGIVCAIILQAFTIAKSLIPHLYIPLIILCFASVYIFTLWLCIKEGGNTSANTHSHYDIKELSPRTIFIRGLYHLNPIFLLIWCLIFERLSPSLSAFWAIIYLIFIILTKDFIFSILNKEKSKPKSQMVNNGTHIIIHGMASGAQSMAKIAVATGVAGLIVGTVSLTGIGLTMTELVEYLSLGNIYLALLFTAIICLLLGIGLPTTANYIVVSSLMAPVLITLATQNGYAIPLVAVHLFVFYFGILADDTPPVGLAAYAASGISGGNPIKTGVQSFQYDIRTAILPFIFVFNPSLLMIGVNTFLEFLEVLLTSLIGILIFTSVIQNYFYIKNKIHESLALLVISISFLYPGLIWDQLYPSNVSVDVREVNDIKNVLNNNEVFNIVVSGINITGNEYKRTIPIETKKLLVTNIHDNENLHLEKMGITFVGENDFVKVSNVKFGSPANNLGFEYGQKVENLLYPTKRPSEIYLYLILIISASLIYFSQKRRKLNYHTIT